MKEDGEKGTSGAIEDSGNEENSRLKRLMQLQTLGVSIVALICGVFNLVEVIVNDRVSFALLAVMFGMVGVWMTVASVFYKAQKKILLIIGIFWLILAFTFTVLWILSLCGVIK